MPRPRCFGATHYRRPPTTKHDTPALAYDRGKHMSSCALSCSHQSHGIRSTFGRAAGAAAAPASRAAPGAAPSGPAASGPLSAALASPLSPVT
eukprot:1022437-Prymnesium_polylepis.2